MEDINFWIEIIIAVLTGLATCIPLVIKLVQLIKDSVKSKNWAPMMQTVLQLMSEAEESFETGMEKKAYVIERLNAVQNSLNYDIDMDVVDALIDAIVLTSKKINTK